MLTVRTAIAAEIADGLMLQFRRYTTEERTERLQALLDARERNESTFECLVALQDDRVVGAQLLIRQRDDTFYVWPAELEKWFAQTTDAAEALRQLYELADQRFRDSQFWIAQSLLELDRKKQSAEMTRNGFPYLTDLLFLGRSFVGAEPLPDRPTDLRSVAFDEPVNGERFARLLEATYIGTLDCPELNDGERTGANALAGHKIAGQFDPQGWRLFQVAGEDVGISLLTQHFPDPIWEVVYIGIVPSARGRGLGKTILIDSLHYAHGHGAWEMVLGVDIRNKPAIAMYEQLGFAKIEQRLVHARLKPKS